MVPIMWTYLRHPQQRQHPRAGSPAESPRTPRSPQSGSASPRRPPPTPLREVLLNAGPQRQAFLGNAVDSTKYALLSFLPSFLFMMFSQAAYLYFLIQAALAWWPRVSPYNPWGSTLALLFVLLVAAVKEVYEDVRRRRSDYVTNARPACIRVGDGAFRPARWRDVRVGQLLLVGEGEEVPADLLLLHTPHPSRTYVSTANLDGETSLKPKRAAAWLSAQDSQEVSVSAACHLRGRVTCEPPSPNLRSFSGTLHAWHSATEEVSLVTLSLDNLMLRGSTVKLGGAGGRVLGLVLYAGAETRVQLNARRPPFKAGAFDRFLNVQIALLIGLQAALCAGLAVGAHLWRSAHRADWYFDWPQHVNEGAETGRGVLDFLLFWVLMSYLVPISLFVTIELVAFLQGVLIGRDPGLKHPVTGERAVARNTNVAEDLGLISTVYSDKTGTITLNQMRLRALMLADGVAYGGGDCKLEALRGVSAREARAAFDARLGEEAAAPPKLAASLQEALLLLSCCHDLLIDTNGDGCGFSGPSPDEVALAEGAAALGFTFSGREGKQVYLSVSDNAAPTQLETLAVFPFSSERQRMSCVVRLPDGRVLLLMKGADSAMLPRCAASTLPPNLVHGLRALSQRGLRTLVLAQRVLEAVEWLPLLGDRGGQSDASWVATNSAALERGLTFVGATGVEDLLQPGARETMTQLRLASIKIVLITGDGVETAVAVGVSVGLLASPDSPQRLCEESAEAAAARMAELETSSFSSCAAAGGELVIDGATLAIALADVNLSASLARIATSASSVVAARTSPKQKAAFVKLLQRHLKAVRGGRLRMLVGRPAGRTLAIGDGANDVPMLAAADVGVGLVGREGRQAANCADFSLTEFSQLQRLLFVHGSLCVHRDARLIRFSFYKNIALGGLQLWLQLQAGFSGTALFDSISAGLFNVIFSSLPIFVLALTDRPLSDSSLLRHPQLYGSRNRGGQLSSATFWKAFIDGTVASVVCFYVPQEAQTPAVGGPRLSSLASLSAVGKSAYTAVLAVVTVEILLVSHYTTWMLLGSCALSAALWLPLLYLIPRFTFVDEMVGIAQMLIPEPQFWLAVTLAVAICFVARLTWRAGKVALAPSDADILREAEARGQPVSV